MLSKLRHRHLVAMISYCDDNATVSTNSSTPQPPQKKPSFRTPSSSHSPPNHAAPKSPISPHQLSQQLQPSPKTSGRPSSPFSSEQCGRAEPARLVHGDLEWSLQDGRWTDRDDSTRPNSHLGLVRQRDHEYVDEPISVPTFTIPTTSPLNGGCQLPVHSIHPCDGLSPPDHTVKPSDHSLLKPAFKLSTDARTTDRGNFSPCPTPTNMGVHANGFNTLGVHPQGTPQSSNSGRTISEAPTTTRYRRFLHNARKQSIRTHDPTVSTPSLRRSLSSGA
ncbi:hypothetical protein ACSBR1_028285 [Camellia fascicularis]